MNKMIVTVFDNEKSAYQGLSALKALHTEGGLTLYAAAVIAKDANSVVSMKQADDPGPAGTIFGLATGSLLGLLGGPVGLALGAATGAVAGSLFDLAALGVSGDFLREVSENLTPGRTAVVADINEEWVTPLDARMEALGGLVFRRARGEFIDAQVERELAADRAELAQLKTEYRLAASDAKAALKAKFDAAEKRVEARRILVKARIDAIEREGESRIKTLEQQAAKAIGDKKAKIDQHIARDRASHKARVEKLRQAWQLVKEAVAI